MNRVLLHICCGPCAIYPLNQIREEGNLVEGIFYNSNIHPLTEYIKRRDGALECAKRLDTKITILDKLYNPKIFFDAIYGQSNRCFGCYMFRLDYIANYAVTNGFSHFSTSLLYSKFQQHDMLIEICQQLSSKYKIGFYYQDFRIGWKNGIKISKDWGIYRQQYCGCLYSEFERYFKELDS